MRRFAAATFLAAVAVLHVAPAPASGPAPTFFNPAAVIDQDGFEHRSILDEYCPAHQTGCVAMALFIS